MVCRDVGVDTGDAGMSAGAAQTSDESDESEIEFGLSAGAVHFGDAFGSFP